MSHLCTLCDDLAKKKADSKRKGTVGSKGNTIPIIPRTREIDPSTNQIVLMSLSSRFSPSTLASYAESTLGYNIIIRRVYAIKHL